MDIGWKLMNLVCGRSYRLDRDHRVVKKKWPNDDDIYNNAISGRCSAAAVDDGCSGGGSMSL